MKVLFVLPRMVAGGVERVTLNLAVALGRQNVECLLALRHGHGELLTEAKQVFASVDVIAAESMSHFVPRLAALIKTRQPTHLVTAFADIGLLTLIARHRSGVHARLIHGIHNTHAFANRRRGVRGWFRYGIDVLVARILYPRVDAIVCVSTGIEAEVKASCPSAAARTRTIYNPVADDADIARILEKTRQCPAQEERHWRIVGMGRLTSQKGFDVLIDAAVKMPTSPAWRIDIYGDGPLRDSLQRQIELHGLQHRITLHGYTSQPHGVLENADVFVLASRHEGFGLVIAEAMLHGVQVVSTNCPHGPSELLDSGRLGQLVPVDDAAALADALHRTMSRSFWVDPAELQLQAARYSTESSVAKWLALLVST